MYSRRREPSPRPATFGDAGRVATLVTQLGYPSTEDDVQRRLARVLANSTHAVFVIEDENAVVVGCIHAHVQWLVDYEPFVEIDSLVVDEAARGRGLGSRLVTAVEEWADDEGLAIVRVRSRVERADAHRFYERLGYERRKTQHVFQRSIRG